MYNPVCHGVNSRVTCWVPNAVQKTYINRVMVIFQVAALVLIALELVSQIIGNAHSHLVHGIWWGTLRELKKGHCMRSQDSKSEADISADDVMTSPLSYHYPENAFSSEPEDEPRLYPNIPTAGSWVSQSCKVFHL